METYRSTIVAALPEGWVAKESLTLLSGERDANVIASSEPVPPEMTSEEYSNLHAESLRQFFGYREISYKPLKVFNGHDGYMRRFEHVSEDGMAISQTQLYFAQGGRGYVATATTSTRLMAHYETALLDILDSLVVEP